MEIKVNLPGNFRLDFNVIGNVLAVLGVIAAIVGIVAASGALHDDNGSSRGASVRVVDPSEVERPKEALAPEDRFIMPETAISKSGERFTELAQQAEEAMRRQDELLKKLAELNKQQSDNVEKLNEISAQFPDRDDQTTIVIDPSKDPREIQELLVKELTALTP